MRPRNFRVSILSTGHALGREISLKISAVEFQSPIYGSRTAPQPKKKVLEDSFNPLSTGHARYCRWSLSRPLFVSIPYLRVTHSGYIVPQNGGSCVSIPYLRVTHRRCGTEKAGRISVSIPYLRVTHSLSEPTATGLMRVSIPYLRVTHLSV